MIDVSGAAVLKSSKHQAAAQQFLAFLVSKPAQEIIGGHSLSYEYPIASGVTTAAPETPFSQLQPNSDHDRRPRHRVNGHHPAPAGRPAVTPGRPRPGGYR